MLERIRTTTSVLDVLDRVLDKGIVIDVWMRVSLVGIDLLTVEARVVVVSVGTYMTYPHSPLLSSDNGLLRPAKKGGTVASPWKPGHN